MAYENTQVVLRGIRPKRFAEPFSKQWFSGETLNYLSENTGLQRGWLTPELVAKAKKYQLEELDEAEMRNLLPAHSYVCKYVDTILINNMDNQNDKYLFVNLFVSYSNGGQWFYTLHSEGANNLNNIWVRLVTPLGINDIDYSTSIYILLSTDIYGVGSYVNQGYDLRVSYKPNGTVQLIQQSTNLILFEVDMSNYDYHTTDIVRWAIKEIQLRPAYKHQIIGTFNHLMYHFVGLDHLCLKYVGGCIQFIHHGDVIEEAEIPH